MLISNSCISSWIFTKIFNQEINHPLVWCTIDPESMCNLIENFYAIDFSKYCLRKYTDSTFSIVIDNKVRVNYVHYKKDINENNIKVIETNVFYNKIEDFIIQKYEQRLKRFNKNDKPVFILGFPSDIKSEANYTKDDVKKIIEHNINKFKIITCINDCNYGDEVIKFPKNKFIDNGLDFSTYIYNNSNILKDMNQYFEKKNEFIEWCKGRYNLDNPKTIQDKIQWLKLNDSTDLKTCCADKILLHDYCKEKLGKDICIPVIKVFNDFCINLNELPKQFVLKCNHGSGMNIIVKDSSLLDIVDTKNKLEKWLNKDFAFQNHFEYHYHNIKRKIYAEKFMIDEKQKSSLYDYKFWCFNGVPKFFTINEGHGHGPLIHYNLDGSRSSIERLDHSVPIGLDYDKPKNFDLMVEYAKTLSKDFKLVRVDFYEINNEVYLGELTFTPGSGTFRYKNREDEIAVGNMLKLK